MSNIKTTIFGTLAAICGLLSTNDSLIGTIGKMGTALFTFLIGASAKDASNKN